MARSTFSATAITRGRCKYIDFKHCSVKDAIIRKEHLLYEGNTHTTTDIIGVKLSREKREEIWNKSVVHSLETFDEQCYEESESYIYSHQAVIEFWRNRRGVTTAY
jgi:hypothetical protein